MRRMRPHHGIRDAGAIDARTPEYRRDHATPIDVVPLPQQGADPEAPRDLSPDEVTALIAAHRANGGATVGHVAMLLAGPAGWTSSAANNAKSALDRLTQRGLVSQHPKRPHVFLLTTTGKGLAALLADQPARSATTEGN